MPRSGAPRTRWSSPGEATDEDDQEFGDERLLDTAAAFRAGPLPELLDAVFDAVRRFGGSEQKDDQTLLVARARPRASL